MYLFESKINKPEYTIKIGSETINFQIQSNNSIQFENQNDVYSYGNVLNGIDLDVFVGYSSVTNVFHVKTNESNKIEINYDNLVSWNISEIIFKDNENNVLKKEPANVKDGKIEILLEDSFGVPFTISFVLTFYKIVEPNFGASALSISVTSEDRSIYNQAPGSLKFSIYFFHGLITNDQDEQVIDYPFNIWQNMPITGTVPISSALIGNDETKLESYTLGKSLDSSTIYIEFVANRMMADDDYAPTLLYDVIPPSQTALYATDQIAEFVGNINNVSVYRGTYTIHKQSEPLFVDGIHKIQLKLIQKYSQDLIMKIDVDGVVYAKVNSSSIGDSDIII